jgi:autotransporter-associated beta strand protein
MGVRNHVRTIGPAAAISLAALATFASAQQESIITADTFIDSGSPGTYNPSTGELNVPGSIVNGQDIYSYGADGKVKAVTSSYSSSYPFVSATHVLFDLPQSFWSAIGSQPVASVVVSYYPFNDSLSVPDAHDNMELHPLTHAFTVGDGTQSPLVPSDDGGATWDSYDGTAADAWNTPGGDYDAANYALASWTSATLPPSKGSTPFSWDITSLINDSTTRAELQDNGALIKVINEGIFPNNPPPPGGENDFVSFYSADYMTAMGTTNASFLPNVVFTLAFTWNNASANNLWDTTSSNWNNGAGNAPDANDAGVIFNDSNGGSSNYAVTLNATVSPFSVTVNNSSNNYTISGTGSIAGATTTLTKLGSDVLTLSNTGTNTYGGGTTVSAGTLLIAAAGALPAASNVTVTGGTVQLGAGTGVETLSSLSIGAAGAFDVNNNHIIISYAGSQATEDALIRGYLVAGYAGGAWNGDGLDSSAANALFASGNTHYGLGYADGADLNGSTPVVAGLGAGNIEVKYTLYGDANLDGVVNGTDFGILAAHFGQQVSAWDQGDFNYDGVVNGTDFGLLAANFGQQASGTAVELPASDWAALDSFAAANGLMADVPEPACAGMLVIAGLGVLSRRRRL